MLILRSAVVPRNYCISQMNKDACWQQNMMILLTLQSPTSSHIWLDTAKIKVENKMVVTVFIMINMLQ